MKKEYDKIIIGFIGDHNVGKTLAANILEHKGFHKASINDKVEEFAGHLFTSEEISQNKSVILNKIRRKGCSQYKEYWLNLILISVPDNKNHIVFDDLSIDEAESGSIIVYQIVRPNVSTIVLPDIETIQNDSSIKDFTVKIENLYKQIKSKHPSKK